MSVLQYLLAVDVGTSRTAASTARVTSDGGLVTAAFGLGRSSDSAPSAIFVADGELLFGEAAERRGLAQPERLVREFKRRIGDDVPDRRRRPAIRTRGAVRADGRVGGGCRRRTRGRPARRDLRDDPGHLGRLPVGPRGCRARPRDLLPRRADHRARGGRTSLRDDVPARARVTRSPSTTSVAARSTPSSCARKTDGTVRLVGEPTGIADFGGADFDDIVLRHVIVAAGLSAAALTARPDRARRARVAAPRVRRGEGSALVRLRSRRSRARRTDAQHGAPHARRVRGDDRRRRRAHHRRARRVHWMPPAWRLRDLDAILLTGGSSRIPRIAQLLSERFDRPIAIDADPKAIVALGAARELADRRAAAAAAQDDDALAAGVLLRADAAAASAAIAPTRASRRAAAAASHAAQDAAKRRWFGAPARDRGIAGGAMVLAGGIVLAGADRTRQRRPYAKPSSIVLATDWLGFSLVNSSSPAEAEPASQLAAPSPATPHSRSAPSLKAPTKHAKRPSADDRDAGHPHQRHDTHRGDAAAVPDPRRRDAATAADEPADRSGPRRTRRPTRRPRPAGRPDTDRPADRPHTRPTRRSTPHPPTRRADPTPTDPPADPTPTDPPTDPTPDPTPTDPPADPTPTDPPADPTPTDPPADPTPTDPPADPTPDPSRHRRPSPSPHPTRSRRPPIAGRPDEAPSHHDDTQTRALTARAPTRPVHLGAPGAPRRCEAIVAPGDGSARARRGAATPDPASRRCCATFTGCSSIDDATRRRCSGDSIDVGARARLARAARRRPAPAERASRSSSSARAPRIRMPRSSSRAAPGRAPTRSPAITRSLERDAPGDRARPRLALGRAHVPRGRRPVVPSAASSTSSRVTGGVSWLVHGGARAARRARLRRRSRSTATGTGASRSASPTGSTRSTPALRHTDRRALRRTRRGAPSRSAVDRRRRS